MTMRTSTLRNVPSADDWGGDGSINLQPHLTDVPCRGYIAATGGSAGRVAIDEDRTVAVEDRRVGFPLGTDVQVGDIVDDITDRLGAVLFEGPMKVDAVLRRTTHLELTVEKTSWPG